jgi:hypothetical protein
MMAAYFARRVCAAGLTTLGSRMWLLCSGQDHSSQLREAGRMARSKPEPTLQELGESVMALVGQVAGRRLVQILEFISEDKIKPLEAENARLVALLQKHGIDA